MRDFVRRRAPLVLVAAFILGAVVIALAIGRPWSQSGSSPADAASTQGLIPPVPEPTATGPNGLPILPSDPFRPPPTPTTPATPPTPPTGPTTPPPQPPPTPIAPPTIPPAPTPLPSPPFATGAIECQVWIQPGLDPAQDAIRLSVLTDSDVRMVWARVDTPWGAQQGIIGMLDGYGEQTVPGVRVQDARVTIYSAPDFSQASESCRSG